MIVLILICSGFYQLAKRKKLMPAAWAVIAGGSYFGGQLIAIFLFDEYGNYSMSYSGAGIGVSLAGGVVGVVIAWIALEQVAKKKKLQEVNADSDLLDDEQYLEKL